MCGWKRALVFSCPSFGLYAFNGAYLTRVADTLRVSAGVAHIKPSCVWLYGGGEVRLQETQRGKHFFFFSPLSLQRSRWF